MGLSERTSLSAFHELSNYLPGVEVINIELSKDILNLDCVFNILSAKEALLSIEGIKNKESIDKIKHHFNVTEIPIDEQINL